MVRMWLPSALLALVVSLPAPASAQAARNIYCCEDVQGQSICGDALPVACYGRAFREISPRGTVVRSVSAPLTPEEAARMEAENRRKAREEALVRQQRRMDAALLETYRSLDDIDAREARALADVELSIADIRTRQAELAKERTALDAEIAWYGADPVPEALRMSSRALELELRSYQRVLDAKRAEKEAIQERYATDRRRYAELIAGQGQANRTR